MRARTALLSLLVHLAAAQQHESLATPAGGSLVQPADNATGEPGLALRLWLDSAFFSDGEVQIFRDLASWSRGRLVSAQRRDMRCAGRLSDHLGGARPCHARVLRKIVQLEMQG
jgi:hypothetical protein